ncbi:MAG: acyl carrier protein [Flavobacteriaceae bacterium]|uniref:acyl carrier protein n=1 Tax=Flagellimonas algarum TaxID=3230298 RepID=UPI00339AA6E6|nr:acyl carrier protein [Flavobacteriaceae bacterium]
MSEEEKYSKLLGIVEAYLPDDVAASQITKESNFTTELNINSANLVDIVLDVEDAFDIILENEDMDGMQTVADALGIIDKKLAS